MLNVPGINKSISCVVDSWLFPAWAIMNKADVGIHVQKKKKHNLCYWHRCCHLRLLLAILIQNILIFSSKVIQIFLEFQCFDVEDFITPTPPCTWRLPMNLLSDNVS